MDHREFMIGMATAAAVATAVAPVAAAEAPPGDRLRTKAEWVARTAAAARELIEKYDYPAADFIIVDEELARDGISMSAGDLYPREWSDWSSITETGWLRDFPVGLTLHWPSGTDYWGEGYDATDPIYLLSEVEFWANLTPDQLREMAAA